MRLQQSGPNQPPDPVTAIRTQRGVEIVIERFSRQIADCTHTEERYPALLRVGRDAAGLHFDGNSSRPAELLFFFCGRGNTGARIDRPAAKARGCSNRPTIKHLSAKENPIGNDNVTDLQIQIQSATEAYIDDSSRIVTYSSCRGRLYLSGSVRNQENGVLLPGSTARPMNRQWRRSHLRNVP